MRRGTQSKWQVGAIASAASVTAVVALAFAGSAAALPALDEYTPRPPSAGGDESAGTPQGDSSQGQSAQLPAATQEQLQASKDGDTLGTIAASGELGAPSAAKAGDAEASSETSSVPEATGSALDEPWVIAVLLALIGIVAFAVISRRRRDAPE